MPPLYGGLGLVVVHLLVTSLVQPWPPGGLPHRLSHHLFDLSELTALALGWGILCGLWQRFVCSRLWISLIAYAALCSLLMHLVLEELLILQADVLFAGHWSQLAYGLLVMLGGLVVPAGHLVGAWLGSFRRWRLVPVLLALGVMVANHLDLFGAPTPPHFMGQSLLPLLLGRPAELTRPIIAEGRLRRALYDGDQLKVIIDLRHHIMEAYDLARDPQERHSLVDQAARRVTAALGRLQAFFRVHTLGSGPVYRR